MFDDIPDNPDDELACTALLYASGELDPDESEAFERLLAEDQAAREALCQAVSMNLTLAGQETAPDPAYRQRVRHRLQQRRRHQRKMTASPSFFGQPAMWAALGAAAAVVLMLAIHHLVTLPSTPPLTTAPTNAEKPSPSREELEQKLRVSHEQADQLARQLAEPGGKDDERKEREKKLHDLTTEMVEIDTQLLKIHLQQMEIDLKTIREEMVRLGKEREREAQKRYEELLERAKKSKTGL